MENASKENVVVSWVGAEDIRIARAFCARNGIDGSKEEDILSCTVGTIVVRRSLGPILERRKKEGLHI